MGPKLGPCWDHVAHKTLSKTTSDTDLKKELNKGVKKTKMKPNPTEDFGGLGFVWISIGPEVGLTVVVHDYSWHHIFQ